MPDISILTASDEPAWQVYVDSHPEATIYHALGWRDIIYNEYGFEPVYLLAKEVGSVVGVLPMFLIKNIRGRKLVSLPFSIYGGPLGDTDEVITALLTKTVTLLDEKGASCVEIKPLKQINCAEPLGFKSQKWGIGTIMDLIAGKDELWEGMTERSNVSKGARKGLTFSVSEVDRLEDFYRLQLITRKRQGVPTPRLAYYASFFKKMPGMVKLAIVEKNGEAIAGDMFFLFKGKVLLVLNVSDRRYRNYKPNDFMIWNIIKWSCEAGYKTLDHGPISFEDKGLLHFKKKWGGSDIEVCRYYYPAAIKEASSENGSLFFRAMPVRMAALVGSRVIKNFA
jgi:CelD/BcsL family acetyltransferase involved in cellulose biosynthesis